MLEMIVCYIMCKVVRTHTISYPIITKIFYFFKACCHSDSNLRMFAAESLTSLVRGILENENEEVF